MRHFRTKDLCSLLFLVLLANPLDTYPALLDRGILNGILLKNIIQNAINERAVRTLLLMKRQKDINCPLREINAVGLPTLRLNASQTINVKEIFNSEALALVCMSELADSILLSALARNLRRMREARIIIWLHMEYSSDIKDYVQLIMEKASDHSFLNLMILRSSSDGVPGSAIGYRLQPFPRPSLVYIKDLNATPIFPKFWLNFKGRTATILPDLLPPRSLADTDPRTGKQSLFGSSDRFVIEFARKRNLKLRLQRSLKEIEVTDPREIINLTLSCRIDLPIRPFPYERKGINSKLDYNFYNEINSIFIVVPCGQEMSLGDVYIGLKSYSTIVLGMYFIFAILETCVVALVQRIFRRRHKFRYSTFVVNPSSFRGVLGLAIPLKTYRETLSLRQIVMLMSILSLVLTGFFNANLSALLIKQPQYKQVENFQELRESGLRVVFDDGAQNYIKNEIDLDYFKNVVPNVLTVSTRERYRMLLSLNTSYGYQTFSHVWTFLDQYQKCYRRKVLCKSAGLTISNGATVSAFIQKNSVYKVALEDFMYLAQCFGLTNHWDAVAGRKMIASIRSKNIPNNQEFTPLLLKDLKWLGKLIGLGYSIGGLVFIAEILIVYWRNRRL